MRSLSILRLAGLLAGCVLTGGCGALKTPYPAKAYFLVDPGYPDSGTATPVTASPAADQDPSRAGHWDATLKVRQVLVSPPYDGTAFVYKVGPNQFSSDYYSAFLMPSDSMLSGDLRSWLARSGLFTHVVDAGSSVRARYSLEGNLSGFYADFTDRHAPRAVLEAQFSLLSDGNAGPEIVFSKSYSTSAPIRSGNPAGIVDAWDHACRLMLEKLTADLARHAGTARDATKASPD